MPWTIPNVLTVFRLLAAPLLAVAFLTLARPWADWVALALFVGASATDYVDGRLARAWGQQTRFGAMLDPIADKAMVLSALLVLALLSGPNPWIILPAVAILLREVFVSGLREFLGADAGRLAVTRLAKWKTFIQMIAIALLFGQGLATHYFGMRTMGMSPEIVAAILAGDAPDPLGVTWAYHATVWGYYGGLALLWIAATLTLVTGWDYFSKARPYLRDTGKDTGAA